jgi:hypothetical protein
LPILEAMCRGVPALLRLVEGLRSCPRALNELLDDRQLAARLVKLGHQRRTAFTWEAAARHTRGCYERAWPGGRLEHQYPYVLAVTAAVLTFLCSRR